MSDVEATAAPRVDQRGTIIVGDAAKLVMLEERRIQQLAVEGWIQKSERGRYLTVSVVQGYIRYLRDQLKNSTGSAAENRVRDARAAEIEMRNAKTDHELVEYSEVEALLDEISGLLKTEFNGFGAQMTRDLTMRRKIEAGVDAIFTRAAARIGEALAALKQSGEIVDADAEDDA